MTIPCMRLLLLAWLIVAPMPASATLHRAHPESDDTIDFIRFDGAIYLASSYLAQEGESASNPPLDAAALGPVIGEVGPGQIDPADEVTYPNEPCHWDVPEGTAPALTIRDKIYAVPNYSTTFRIAARHNDAITLYQVWCSERAEVGADLFDIYGRVAQIRVTGDLSETSGFADIDDEVTVGALVDMLLAGEILPEEQASSAPVSYQLIFYLDDGSTFRASTAPGEFLWGLGVILVPVAFDETLQRAWQEQASGSQG